jgi:hypothetical protein
LDEEFLSEAPGVFARTIQRMCTFLSKAVVAIYEEIDWSAPAADLASDLLLLQNTDRIARILAEQLQYVEATRTERLPWSIVASFEKLVADFLPGIRIMLSAQWEYNYAFHVSDHREVFRRFLAGYQAFVPDSNIEQHVLNEMDRPFHIVLFPSLEQKHILLHCLLGHEVGHLLADSFFTDARELGFVEGIKNDVNAIVDEDMKTLPAELGEDTRKAVREAQVTLRLEEALTIWKRALEEILSDLAGAILFGPAALFSTLDLTMQHPLDTVPSINNQYYPPLRMRLRSVLALLDEQGGWFAVPSELFNGNTERTERVNSRVELIRSIAASEADRIEIGQVKLVQLVYRDLGAFLSSGKNHLLETKNLKQFRPNAGSLYTRLPALIDRLDHSIPPNAVQDADGSEQVATFAEIINATWLTKMSLPAFAPGKDDLEVGVETRNLMNNLTLKAIEYAHLAREYSEWKA